jgi:hypothetical protein
LVATKDAAQVLDGLAGMKVRRVCLVGERSVREFLPDSRRSASVQPGGQGGGAFGRGERLVERFPVCRDDTGVVGEQLVQVLPDGAASALSFVDSSGLAADRAAVSSASGRVQAEHRGWSRLPPRSGETWWRCAHRIQRCLHAVHQGSPMVLDTTQGAVRPQMAQVSVFHRRQLPHWGPADVRVLTGRRRPQSTQVSWLPGSVIRQCGHNGRPC